MIETLHWEQKLDNILKNRIALGGGGVTDINCTYNLFVYYSWCRFLSYAFPVEIGK